MAKKPITRNLHKIDAAGRAVGRIAAEAALLLTGKNKPDFELHIDSGEFVTIFNAGGAKFTGKKMVQKDYYHHTMYPGGLKRTPVKKVFDENPAEVLRHAINGMLPKNRTRDRVLKRLKIVNGPLPTKSNS